MGAGKDQYRLRDVCVEDGWSLIYLSHREGEETMAQGLREVESEN